MEKQMLLLSVVLLIMAGTVSAQTTKRTITNADLEKFRQSRLSAEKDLRENYAKLGFPSPEEMERRQEQASIERAKLSDELRQGRLEREQIQFQQDYMRSRQYSSGSVVYLPESNTLVQYAPYYSGAFYNRYRGYRRLPQNGTYLPGGGYFGPTFNPNQGVQINTTPIRINTIGPTRPPVRIDPPRN